MDNKNQLYRIAYLSNAREPFTQDMIDALEEKSSQRNTNLGVSGYICYIDPMFFSYIEGEEDMVLSQMYSIQNDTRHEIFSIVDLGVSDKRLFNNWGLIADVSQLSARPALRHLLGGMKKMIHGDDDFRQTVLSTVEMVAGHHSLLNSMGQEQELERASQRFALSAMSA